MRTSQFPLNTLKETPSDAEIISHKLMMRAGMIRKLAAGLYAWLPLGLRVLRRVEQIVREEMDQSGALEISMPVVQPAELWRESGRWEQYGPELTRLRDRHDREFCLGPTHEEIITELARNELKSYKQLPVNYYQIQTKFRDEIRPRFGVMRAREFIMKDAYSFHTDLESLQQTYNAMYVTYSNIFTRLGLRFRAVLADTGSIGGSHSHEFHVLAESGEDAIVFCDNSDYAANVEQAEAVALGSPLEAPSELVLVDTPLQHTIEDVSAFLKVDATRTLKTLLVAGKEGGVVALLLRGDHKLNVIKAEKLGAIAAPLRFATDQEVREAAGCAPGSLGPLGLNIPVYIDRSVLAMVNFVCGANQDGKHYTGVNWGRDLPQPNADCVVDIRNVVDGDPSPDGMGSLHIARGIEVGHIFQLGAKYSEAMNAVVLNEQGKTQTMIMGCYGIGVSRLVAASIEQNHDDKGIIWPDAIAPFQVALVPINMQTSERLRQVAEQLYADLIGAGFSVLFDDRKARPGVMFADMELIGIPHRLVVSEKGLDEGILEYKGRRDLSSQTVPLGEVFNFLQARLQ